ncbi:MAG: response regulator transcription factor [Oscillospiraceae bacterium]|nr:response regulator transcription factor [Oscillospiraceae bacterium]
MIKIAVVDDEQIMLEKICRIIDEQFIEEKMIRSFNNSMNFFNDADKYNFDLVFLDIDMPEMNGFELAENLKLIKPSITIIFISSHENLVFKSFDYNPYRFVRKSQIENDISTAITSFHNNLKKNNNIYHIVTGNSALNVLITDIIYFESLKHEIYVNLTTGKFKLKRERDNEKCITSIANMLTSKGFIRVHKSFLVNYIHIHSINNDSITLKNGDIIMVNPRNINSIKIMHHKFLMEGTL